jgi:23S rRNA (cytidine1920-2'-O)/16S rRNA (cytidine1409-2'-O)-methyltransferase
MLLHQDDDGMKTSKKRLDVKIGELYPHYSRTQIHSYIMQGYATVNGMPETKAGTLVKEDDQVELNIETPKYVCRAGTKLEHALSHFGVDVKDKIILDAGLSTGGFTDCLLQMGAKKIYGVDVGYGQVHEKIRHDPRVVVMERTNLRHLTTLPESVDIVTLDLSFISILKVMDAVNALLKPDGILLTLIKPQFEAERKDVGRGGIIKNPAVHERVLKTVIAGIEAYGFESLGHTESPILGGSGNKEFLALFKRVKNHA